MGECQGGRVSRAILVVLAALLVVATVNAAGLLRAENCKFQSDISTCYQETATNTSECGSLAVGNYSRSNSSVNISGTLHYRGHLNVEYGKPLGALSAIWEVNHGSLGKYNVTIPAVCFSANDSFVKLRMVGAGFSSGYRGSWGDCYNGSGWTTITNVTSDGGIVGVIEPYQQDESWRLYDGSAATFACSEDVWSNITFTPIGESWEIASLSYNCWVEEGIYWNISTANIDSCTDVATISCDVSDTNGGIPPVEATNLVFTISGRTYTASRVSGNNTNGTWAVNVSAAGLGGVTSLSVTSMVVSNSIGTACTFSPSQYNLQYQTSTCVVEFENPLSVGANCSCTEQTTTEFMDGYSNMCRTTRVPSAGCVDQSTKVSSTACDWCDPEWKEEFSYCEVDLGSESPFDGRTVKKYSGNVSCCVLTGLQEDCTPPIDADVEVPCILDYCTTGGGDALGTNSAPREGTVLNPTEYVDDVVAATLYSGGPVIKPLVFDVNADGVTETLVFAKGNVSSGGLVTYFSDDAESGVPSSKWTMDGGGSLGGMDYSSVKSYGGSKSLAIWTAGGPGTLGDLVVLEHNLTLTNLTNVRVSAWVYDDVNDSFDNYFNFGIGTWGTPDNDLFLWCGGAGVPNCNMSMGYAAHYVNQSLAYPPYTMLNVSRSVGWHHLELVYEGGVKKWYLDGIMRFSINGTGLPSVNKLYISSSPWTTGVNFTVYVDNIEVTDLDSGETAKVVVYNDPKLLSVMKEMNLTTLNGPVRWLGQPSLFGFSAYGRNRYAWDDDVKNRTFGIGLAGIVHDVNIDRDVFGTWRWENANCSPMVDCPLVTGAEQSFKYKGGFTLTTQGSAGGVGVNCFVNDCYFMDGGGIFYKADAPYTVVTTKTPAAMGVTVPANSYVIDAMPVMVLFNVSGVPESVAVEGFQEYSGNHVATIFLCDVGLASCVNARNDGIDAGKLSRLVVGETPVNGVAKLMFASMEESTIEGVYDRGRVWSVEVNRTGFVNRSNMVLSAIGGTIQGVSDPATAVCVGGGEGIAIVSHWIDGAVEYNEYACYTVN